ncbi:hypothetical protein [Hymenobacter sp. BT559]|uniref:hypothetical protein n=1 Tax=Hymenobacter sp. BT559 TaxID=2795729 RepID=UPI0018EE27E4|nr:hypothetical protein [Hymenobacter sp. BT559]MBJ6143319.1 hypothetical protein [Hymenobacter sp. BT559]
MKKLLLLAAIGLTAVGSWAFYPEAAAPTGYLMVVGSGRPGTTSSVPEITTIQPDGTRQVQRLPDIKIGTERNSTAAAVELHRAELLKINTLTAQGWRVAHVTQSTVGVGATTETVYLLERP